MVGCLSNPRSHTFKALWTMKLRKIYFTHTKINCLFYLLGKQCRSSPHSNLCAPSLPEIRPNLEYERVSYKFVCIEVLYVFYVLYFRVILLPPPLLLSNKSSSSYSMCYSNPLKIEKELLQRLR